MRKIERILISDADGERLERLVRDRNTPQKVVWRARIVLLASDGLTAEAISAAVGKSLLTVRRWRRRYVARGVASVCVGHVRTWRVPSPQPQRHRKPRAQSMIFASATSLRSSLMSASMLFLW
jgi:hypothetical protein